MVALDVCDPTNPHNMAVIRGCVSEGPSKGPRRTDKMAKRYMRQDKFQVLQHGVRRVLIKIEPTRVMAPFTDTLHWKA